MSAVPARRSRPVGAKRRWTHVLAGVLYLGAALWAFRVVLPAPETTLPFPPYADRNLRELDHHDQRAMLALVMHNARALLNEPWTLFRGAQCHPLARPFTLGEHGFIEGLLTVVPYAITGDPVFTYNAMLVTIVWLAAVSMYILVYSATGSASAAFVAGFLFAFSPVRIVDPAHPMVHGNQWTPLALLFAHRLFTRPSWGNAAGLAAFLNLQLLDGVYQSIALVILGGCFGLSLVLRYFRRLPELIPKLLAVGAVTVVVLVTVFGAYLHTKAVWGTLQGHFSLLYPIQNFGFGGPAYVGSVMVALAAIGLLDRLRGARRSWGYDPRLVVLAGGLVVLWMVVWFVPIPFTGIRIPSPYMMAVGVLPGLDAVRALPAAHLGVNLAAAFLAGYGMLALTEHRSTLVAAALTAVATVAAFVELFHPPAARASFRMSGELAAYQARPPEAVLALYDRIPDGAVLDLPLMWKSLGVLLQMGHYSLLSAYHHQTIAACANSFGSPLQPEVEALANRVPAPEALEALHALGFRTIVVHGEFYFGRTRPMHDALVAQLGATRGGVLTVEPLGEAEDHRVFALASRTPVTTSLEPLGGVVEPVDAVEVVPPGAIVRMPFHNAGPSSYRHPDPIEPTPLLVRWQTPAGDVVAEYRMSALLPLALAPNEQVLRPMMLPVPDVTGEHLLTLAPAATPDRVVSRRTVTVRRGGAAASPPATARSH